MSNNSIAVKITEVSKRYGYLQALKSVSLEIAASEFLVFSGHNGAGKTTLLKIIATHISPSSGTLKIFGADAFKNGGETRRRIGLVTHESFLYDELTVRSHEMQALVRKGRIPADIEREILEAYRAMCHELGEDHLKVSVRSSTQPRPARLVEARNGRRRMSTAY